MAVSQPVDYGAVEVSKLADPIKKGGEEGRLQPNGGFFEEPYLALAGLILAAGAVFFHLIPCVFLILSYCSEYGCFGYGCDDQMEFHQCLPCYSNTILERTDDESSHTRRSLALVSVCIRSPLCFLCLRYAYRRIVDSIDRPGTRDAESRIFLFEVLMLAFILLDIAVVYVPNTGSTKVWHILTAFCLMCLWTLVIVPLFSSVVSATQILGQDHGMSAINSVWIIWVLSFTCGIWLLLSWFVSRGVQWYVFEWLYVFAQGFQILALGLALQNCQLRCREPDEAG